MNISITHNYYNLVRSDIIKTAHNIGTTVAFTNCAPFIKSITKIDGTTIDYAEDLDLVMLMYNLIEYNSNYSGTTESLLFYSKDETTNFDPDFADNNTFNPLMTALLRNCLIFLKFCVLVNFRLIIS